MQFSYFILTNVKITNENTYPNPAPKSANFLSEPRRHIRLTESMKFFSEKGYETDSVPFEELG